jgi:hypothetical protein
LKSLLSRLAYLIPLPEQRIAFLLTRIGGFDGKFILKRDPEENKSIVLIVWVV